VVIHRRKIARQIATFATKLRACKAAQKSRKPVQ